MTVGVQQQGLLMTKTTYKATKKPDGSRPARRKATSNQSIRKTSQKRIQPKRDSTGKGRGEVNPVIRKIIMDYKKYGFFI
jgi:hypothetical protein